MDTDGNWNAKISDFGIARIPQEGIVEISHVGDTQYAKEEIPIDEGYAKEEIPVDEGSYYVMTQVTTTLNGTMGYIDPEYLKTFRVTLKSDIYSFGVVLLNVVSGRRPVYSTDEINLLSEEARRLHKTGRLTELIDPRLINPDGVTNSSTILRTIIIALCCIEKVSERRPSASQVLEMLCSEDEISIPTPPLQPPDYSSSEDEISIPTSPLQSPDYSSSEDEIPICNSSGKSSEKQIISSSTLPLDFLSGEGSLSQENWMPIFPPILTSADYNF